MKDAMLALFLTLNQSLFESKFTFLNHVGCAKGAGSRNASGAMNQNSVGVIFVESFFDPSIGFGEIICQLLRITVHNTIYNLVLDTFICKIGSWTGCDWQNVSNSITFKLRPGLCAREARHVNPRMYFIYINSLSFWKTLYHFQFFLNFNQF